MTVSIKRVTSVESYIEKILALRGRWYPTDTHSEIWFRGSNDHSLSLLPGAYWRKNCDELSMVLSFRSMAPALLPREPIDDWDWYYLMQHYGLPTRLLDWSESPLSALYFALEYPLSGKVPCVWVLDPVSLNRLSGADYIHVPPGGQLDNWLPDACGRGMPILHWNTDGQDETNARPIAIFPRRYNPRIVAQRGTFTIHGADQTAINEMSMTDSSGADRSVICMEIEPSARDRIWDELWALGTTKTSIYPEPQSLAEDLKRQYHAK